MPATSIKTHYPSIAFDPSPVLEASGINKAPHSKGRKSESGQQSSLCYKHRDAARRLVRAVCETELDGLITYFADEAYNGKDAVLGPMRHVLESLPTAVDAALDDLLGEWSDSEEGDVPLFYPEVPSATQPSTSSATITLQVRGRDSVATI